MEEFRNLKRVALNELRRLDAAYANKDEFSETDAEKYDCTMHALKCHLAVEGMLYAYDEDQFAHSDRARSYAPRRMSYDQMPAYSGHYPPPDYPRNW